MPPRGPQYYGAWVLGKYYAPGQFLPKTSGTMMIRDYFRIPDEMRRPGSSGFLTIEHNFAYGTPLADISSKLIELLEQKLAQESPPTA